jgi:hypothetical protein
VAPVLGRGPVLIDRCDAATLRPREEVTTVGLERVASVLVDEAIRMEAMANRLEVLIPAIRREEVDEIARRAVDIADFAGPAELFDTAGAREATARFERARRRLLVALGEPEDACP